MVPVIFSACSSSPHVVSPAHKPSPIVIEDRKPTDKGMQVVMYSMNMMDTGYRFGGKNPEAGLDCSGMVSHVYGKAADHKVSGSAADIAAKGRQIDISKVLPGDLVFFNTRGKPHSHVGIYVGDGRFIHAPRSRSKVKIDRLDSPYYAARLMDARNYF